MMMLPQQRGLSNELGPRYGSERPASGSSSSLVHQLNSTAGSPVKVAKFRQTNSLSEQDEINYNQQQQQIHLQMQVGIEGTIKWQNTQESKGSLFFYLAMINVIKAN